MQLLRSLMVSSFSSITFLTFKALVIPLIIQTQFLIKNKKKVNLKKNIFSSILVKIITLKIKLTKSKTFDEIKNLTLFLKQK